jgi:anti-sigma factor RsiW
MSHLGRWLSALVDGELDPEERDRVLNHLARCDGCLGEANAMRALKRRLTALGEASDDSAIAGRLIELSQAGPDHSGPDRTGPDQAGPDRASPGSMWASWQARAPWPKSGTTALRSRRPPAAWPLRSWRLAAGSAGSALVAMSFAAFLLGSTQTDPPVPKVTPAVDSYWSQHIYDAGQEPASSQQPQPQGASTSTVTPGPPGQDPAGPAQLEPWQLGIPAATGSAVGPAATTSGGAAGTQLPSTPAHRPDTARLAHHKPT